MRKLLMKAGVPLVAGALVLTGFQRQRRSPTPSTTATAKPTYSTLPTRARSRVGTPSSASTWQYRCPAAPSTRRTQVCPSSESCRSRSSSSHKDDQGSATLSPTDAQELVSNKSVIGVVGPAFSGATKAAEPTFSSAPPRNGEPVGHPARRSPPTAGRTSSASSLTTASRVRLTPTTSSRSSKLKKIYVVNDASTYGVGPRQRLRRPGDRRTGRRSRRARSRARPQCTDGTASPTQYPDRRRDRRERPSRSSLFYGGYYCDLGLLLGALHNAGYNGKVMSGDGSDATALIRAPTRISAANGVYASCACAVLGSNSG